MKNIFKAFIFMILTFALCIPMQIIVKASTYTDMGTKKNVAVSKSWTVKFNKSLSSNTVNTTNIKVVGVANKNIDINISLANNNKNVIVSPVKNYDANTPYTLIVTNKVKSTDGKPLSKEVRMEFTTGSPTKGEFTVCIDPAQYYTVNTGEGGAKAKDINLGIALKLGNILKTRGFNVVYTRNSDAVSWDKLNENDAKAAIAKNAKADVFLSINTNSYSSNTANGIETYYLSDVSNNKLLAGLMQSELIKATQASDRGIKASSGQENLEILKKINCLGVVLELGFLSNPQEEMLLTNEKYQNNAAKAMANGLMNYAGFANTDTSYATIFSVSSVKDIIVNLQVGNQYSFPKTVEATMIDNSKIQVGVEWPQDLVSLTKSGTYTYEGIIKNYDKKVKVTINVKDVISTNYKVVLDAGHGGKDPGAVGPMGTEEKTVVLAITLKIGNILAKNGVEVIYTRTTDITQSLQEKTDISNNAKPNYFVSIHANSYSIPTVSGIETFYSSGSAAGQKLAEAVQTELIKATGRVDRKVKTAGFYVLNNTDATAILVETSFVSNPTEEKLLVTEAYQIKLARAISTGILKCLGITNIVF